CMLRRRATWVTALRLSYGGGEKYLPAFVFDTAAAKRICRPPFLIRRPLKVFAGLRFRQLPAAVPHASGCVHQKAHSQQVSAPHILSLIPLASETHRALHLFDHPARSSRRALCTSVEDVIEGTAVELIVDPVLEPDEECFDDFTEVCLEFAVALAVVIEFEI